MNIDFKKYLIFKKYFLLLFVFCNLKVHAVVFTVINTNDAGVGSLRQAILDANALPGNDVINFNLGVGGPFTITLLSALPNLTDNTGLTIDGWDNSGNNGVPNSVAVFSTSIATPLNPVYKIILGNGANIPVGLNISSSNNLIRGLVLNDFGDGVPSGNDICISISAANNTIVGCYIGMAQDGSTMGPRPYYGIYCTNRNNIIGDGTNEGVNLISGMGGNGGVKLYFSGATATANIVRGNIIGLQSNGTSALTASSTGIYLIGSAHQNTIGGTGTFDGNLISGNRGTGISVSSNSNVIQGNYIGPLADGISGLVGTMQSNGLGMGGHYNLLGGSVVGARNLISGNTNLGMDMSGTNNRIKGNYWGPNKFGTARLSVSNNSGLAVNTGTGNIIGGPNPGDGNLMSGLPGMAIWLLFNVGPVTSVIQQNTIGIAANGTSSLTGGGNGTGILMMLNTCNNVIGGSSANERNIISGSGTGISISSNCGGNNLFKGNYIGLASNGINRVIGASQSYGISVSSVSITNNMPNIIGGTGAGEGNVISGNNIQGIYLNSITSSLTVVRQNTIGPQANGTSTLVGGNVQGGISIVNSHTNIIGGSSANARNIISANNGQGILVDGISSKRNIITGNFIGPGGSGTSIAGATQLRGVTVQNSASTNSIGGFLGGLGANPQGNNIAYNTGDGVYLFSVAADSNLISRNLIYLNGAASRPINLNYGANQGNAGKAVPTIMTVTTSVVTGSGAVTAGVGDTVEVFANTTGNCRDLMIYKGSTLADAVGNWTLSGITINNGESVLATARTLANNNTGEVSICTVPLPIELIYFTAGCDNKKIKLKWATASEYNSDDFIVERTSDGLNYKLIGELNAAGKSSNKIEYSLTDEDITEGSVTYRLKQNDLNGNFKYYYSAYTYNCIGSNEKIPVTIFPNPGSENVSVKIPNSKDEIINLQVTDFLGKIIISKEYVSVSGSDPEILNVEQLSKGMYVIKINSPSRNECIKFSKN